MSKQSISQPSHDFVRLSDGTEVRVLSDRSGVEVSPTDFHVNPLLDANDAVRLAAFLNRFYTEQNRSAQRTEAQTERRAAAARAVK